MITHYYILLQLKEFLLPAKFICGHQKRVFANWLPLRRKRSQEHAPETAGATGGVEHPSRQRARAIFCPQKMSLGEAAPGSTDLV